MLVCISLCVQVHARMGKETSNDRVNVALSRDTHAALVNIARLLGKNLQDAAEEAVQDWNRKNASAARKKVSQLMPAN